MCWHHEVVALGCALVPWSSVMRGSLCRRSRDLIGSGDILSCSSSLSYVLLNLGDSSLFLPVLSFAFASSHFLYSKSEWQSTQETSFQSSLAKIREFGQFPIWHQNKHKTSQILAKCIHLAGDHAVDLKIILWNNKCPVLTTLTRPTSYNPLNTWEHFRLSKLQLRNWHRH
jgi:hypothetical protein